MKHYRKVKYGVAWDSSLSLPGLAGTALSAADV